MASPVPFSVWFFSSNTNERVIVPTTITAIILSLINTLILIVSVLYLASTGG
jgi:hypothetical protein